MSSNVCNAVLTSNNALKLKVIHALERFQLHEAITLIKIMDHFWRDFETQDVRLPQCCSPFFLECLGLSLASVGGARRGRSHGGYKEPL